MIRIAVFAVVLLPISYVLGRWLGGLRDARIIRRWHYWAVQAVYALAVAVASALVVGNIAAGVAPAAVGVLYAVWAWLRRNDDDDNDEGRRKWEAARARLPKPRLIALRPIGVPT